jgi:cytidylate kinase
MTDSPFPLKEDLDPSGPAAESPHHGFRGHPQSFDNPGIPGSLTIAISREAGSRGASIAKRVGEKLGWQVYTQELLEYIAQEGTFRQDLANQLSTVAHDWVEEKFNQLLREQNLSRNPSILEMARIILSLGSQGDVILLGRGAGCILPARSTLHIRLIAPLPDRIAYTSQWLRLTEEEAIAHVHQRDASRSEFLATHFHRKPDDIYQYDLILNSSRLGEELCADQIIQAAQAKRETLENDRGIGLEN